MPMRFVFRKYHLLFLYKLIFHLFCGILGTYQSTKQLVCVWTNKTFYKCLIQAFGNPYPAFKADWEGRIWRLVERWWEVGGEVAVLFWYSSTFTTILYSSLNKTLFISGFIHLWFSSLQFSSVAQSCPTLWPHESHLW